MVPVRRFSMTTSASRASLLKIVLAFGRVERERERALVDVERQEAAAHLRFQEFVAHLGNARRIAFVRILDGDDVGAVHREMPRRERRGDDAGDGEDLDAGEELSGVCGHAGWISSAWNLQRRLAPTEAATVATSYLYQIQEERMSSVHPAGRCCLRLSAPCSRCARAGALAQSYPVKPIRLVVPFPAGASSDVVGRMIGTEDLGADGPAGHRGQSRRRRGQPGNRRRGQVTARRLHDPDRHREHRRQPLALREPRLRRDQGSRAGRPAHQRSRTS